MFKPVDAALYAKALGRRGRSGGNFYDIANGGRGIRRDKRQRFEAIKPPGGVNGRRLQEDKQGAISAVLKKGCLRVLFFFGFGIRLRRLGFFNPCHNGGMRWRLALSRLRFVKGAGFVYPFIAQGAGGFKG